MGERPPYILVDTGGGNDTYADLLRKHLESDRAADGVAAPITDIIVTHKHADHFGGLPSVLGLLRDFAGQRATLTDSRSRGIAHHGPRIHKFPSTLKSSRGSDSEHQAYNHEEQYNSVLSSLPADTFTPSPAGAIVHDLSDGQVIATADGSSALRIVHTPGHTPDSICIFLQKRQDHDSQRTRTPNSDTLFTADSVLGQGTAVFEDLSSYISSLQRLVSPDFSTFRVVYPGHGPVVEDGPSAIRTYISHRLERESQIIDVLKRLQSSGCEAVSVWDIVKDIYKDYPENLWLPAAKGVVLHLQKLEVDGRVTCEGGEGTGQKWKLIS